MRYIEFMDISLPFAQSSETIVYDPWLASVASLKTTDGLPLVSHWIDPAVALSNVTDDYIEVRDAANAGVYKTVTQAQTSGVLQQTTALNGQPTFTAAVTSPLGQGTAPNVNTDAWTMIAVHDLSASPIGSHHIFGIGVGGTGAGFLYPTLEITKHGSDPAQDSLIVREGGTTTRRIFPQVASIARSPGVAAATFSTDRGLSVIRNLSTVSTVSGDTRPLTVPTFSYLGNRSAAATALGVFGMAMILRDDLSRPEYAAARGIILGGLMSKYGIV